MARGSNATVGDERISANGYWYIKTEDCWRLKHHVVAEEMLGRKLGPEDRVEFIDKKRDNLDPKNIRVVEKGRGSLRRRKAQLEARRDEINAQLKEIEKQLAR